MPSLPLITGIGLATPLGHTVSATWSSLCAGRAIVDHARVPGIDAASEPRVNILALRVAREAIAEACWRDDDLRSAALVVGTSKGPVDAWLESAGLPQSRSSQPLTFGLAETATSVASALDIRGPTITLSAACASGLHALIRAAMMIRAGEVNRVLVVASESSMHPLFIASFHRLGVIPPDGHGCRPFDRTRAGFVIGEAAAALCIEAAEERTADAPPYAAIERFAMGADATHLTAGDPQGQTLRHVLRRVSDGRPLDLIHAHGTGTVTNDPVELAAIEASLSSPCGKRPSLYSHKGALGHSLGAAGLVAVAINCVSHRDGIIPPNVNSRQPIDANAVSIRPDLHRRIVGRSLAIAAGFGGAVAAVSLMKSE